MKTRMLGCACIAATVLGSTAAATTLYSQTTPDADSGFFSTSNSSFLSNAVRRVADNFTIGSGGGALVETVRWYGFTRNATTTVDVSTTVTSFTVDFYSDDAFGVGSLLYSETFGIGDTNATLSPPPSAPAALLYTHEVSLSTAFLASSGTTYWISIYAAMTTPAAHTWLWVNDAQGGDDWTDTMLDNNGVWIGPFDQPPGRDLHFELIGTVIPLPSVAGLSMLGLTVVGGVRRRPLR